ncbi:MAG: RHS repeat-associated core domain-containing protein [Anaerolineae bacterium]|nr:RHS repeat-associated core domain-containing protein [Anaerolineae bacterium]
MRATDNVNNAGAWAEASTIVAQVTKYYAFGGRRIAMRRGDVVYYLHADHLGSVSVVSDGGGALLASQRYYPYGEIRYATGVLPTDFGFTGQRAEAGLGLLDYRARFYDPVLGRFVSADTVVPNPGNSQDLNRYAYVRNNPLRYTDPSGCWTFEESPDDPYFIGPWLYEAQRRRDFIIPSSSPRQPLASPPSASPSSPASSTFYWGLLAYEMGPREQGAPAIDALFSPWPDLSDENWGDLAKSKYVEISRNTLKDVYGGPEELAQKVTEACATNFCNNSWLDNDLWREYSDESRTFIATHLPGATKSTAQGYFLKEVGASPGIRDNYEPWWLLGLMRTHSRHLMRAQGKWVAEVYLRDPEAWEFAHKYWRGWRLCSTDVPPPR